MMPFLYLVVVLFAMGYFAWRSNQRRKAAVAAELRNEIARRERLRDALIKEHGPDLGMALYEQHAAQSDLARAALNSQRRTNNLIKTGIILGR